MLTSENQIFAPEASGCLKGAPAWLISAGKDGMMTQAKGIADALGLDWTFKKVEPKGIWKVLAPWGPVSPKERFGQPGSAFAPPWPTIAIAVGRASIPYICALKRHSGDACYTVVLQDPRSGPGTADLIWVPAHDKRRGANVITTIISPHGIKLEQIEALRREVTPEIAALPTPRVAVILGGRNSVYKFNEGDDARLVSAIRRIARLGASFLITTSRRTHPELLAAVEQATAEAPRILWRGEEDGANPYASFLAQADYFVITADSVNMTGEACITGKPIYVFHPTGGSAKFKRYHDSLAAIGATRPLTEQLNELGQWSYKPQVSADLIAHEIERRYLQHARNAL